MTVFFASMKLTLLKSQVHSYGVVQWWACSSLMSPPLPVEAGTKVASGLFYCWSLLRDNNMATILQRLTLYYGGRRFVAWNCWTHTSWQVIQRDSDHAESGKPRTFILCETKHEWVYSNVSISLKNPLLVRVWPMCLSVILHLCRLLFMQYKITWFVTVEYIYAGLWEYVFIVIV